MSLAPDDIARIDALLAALGPRGDALVLDAALARLLPAVGRRHCDAADVLEEPFRSAPGTDLHLLDTRGHCIRLTADPAEATGLLLAAHPGEAA